MLDKKLVNAANQMEADFLCDLLEKEGIVSLQKLPGAGGIMQLEGGVNTFSMYGVDIYVSEENYDKAKELVDEFYA